MKTYFEPLASRLRDLDFEFLSRDDNLLFEQLEKSEKHF
jgi:hypothetical protein